MVIITCLNQLQLFLVGLLTGNNNINPIRKSAHLHHKVSSSCWVQSGPVVLSQSSTWCSKLFSGEVLFSVFISDGQMKLLKHCSLLWKRVLYLKLSNTVLSGHLVANSMKSCLEPHNQLLHLDGVDSCLISWDISDIRLSLNALNRFFLVKWLRIGFSWLNLKWATDFLKITTFSQQFGIILVLPVLCVRDFMYSISLFTVRSYHL